MKIHRFRFESIPDTETFHLHNHQLIHQIKDVLELRLGEAIQLFNDEIERRGVIQALLKDEILIQFVENIPALSYRLKEVEVAISLLKGDAWEEVIRNLSQLGVASVQPLVCDRNVVKELSGHKLQRYQHIATEATELSGGRRLLRIKPVMKFEQWINRIQPTNTFVFHSKGQDWRPSVSLSTIILGFGPEGGWSDNELSIVSQHHLPVVSLSPRTLTSRLAPTVATSYLLARSSQTD